MGKMIINYSILRREALKTVAEDKDIARLAFDTVNADFIVAKEQMLDDFDNHPVTRELKGGENSDNFSSSITPEGNLFSFIGFNAGEDPTDPIRALLEAAELLFVHEPKYTGKLKLRYAFPARIPTIKDIAKVTPMPGWTNGSWAERIEKSITGVKKYLYTTEAKDRVFKSRSTTGIQIKGNLSKSFDRVQYMSEILGKFNTRILTI